ncbi:MAG: helix-turn-helix transcriptional regulator [Antarcticimicrobium sp.]|uniref:helix-turn-helix domain-containing protein n=1 Tax=Antarcticimicrobium sp. TaxID=2824147 RepID=UPI00261EAD93|nr:helix-turn-helix transcriptional regulator [Antarcticimicrobium sp.]MDF1716441.1 helix-turn-helix transcriptional regulator [Antarcticimicrobium sp.]
MNEIDVFVGNRIRARRYALGISQSELGAAIGVRFQQIQKYETGANRVSASRLWAVAEKLGVDIEYFFQGIRPVRDGDDDSGKPENRMAFLSDQESIQMMELFHQLPSSQRSAVLAIVRSMAEAPLEQSIRVAT